MDSRAVPAVEFKLFSPDPLNCNFNIHKMANVFLLSLKGPDGKELVGTVAVASEMTAIPSPHSCTSRSTCNFTNQGRLLTSRQER